MIYNKLIFTKYYYKAQINTNNYHTCVIFLFKQIIFYFVFISIHIY